MSHIEKKHPEEGDIQPDQLNLQMVPMEGQQPTRGNPQMRAQSSLAGKNLRNLLDEPVQPVSCNACG